MRAVGAVFSTANTARKITNLRNGIKAFAQSNSLVSTSGMRSGALEQLNSSPAGAVTKSPRPSIIERSHLGLLWSRGSSSYRKNSQRLSRMRQAKAILLGSRVRFLLQGFPTACRTQVLVNAVAGQLPADSPEVRFWDVANFSPSRPILVGSRRIRKLPVNFRIADNPGIKTIQSALQGFAVLVSEF